MRKNGSKLVNCSFQGLNSIQKLAIWFVNAPSLNYHLLVAVWQFLYVDGLSLYFAAEKRGFDLLFITLLCIIYNPYLVFMHIIVLNQQPILSIIVIMFMQIVNKLYYEKLYFPKGDHYNLRHTFKNQSFADLAHLYST